MTDQLQQGIDLYKSGEKDLAARFFYRLATTQPDHEQAWSWLAASVEDKDKRIYCFKKILAINPNNAAVRKELEALTISAAPPPDMFADEEPEPHSYVTIEPTIDPDAKPGYYIPPTYRVHNPDMDTRELAEPEEIRQSASIPLRTVLRFLFDALLVIMPVIYLVIVQAQIWPLQMLIAAALKLIKIHQNTGLVSLSFVPLDRGDYLAIGLIALGLINFFMPGKIKTVMGVAWVVAGAWMGYSILYLTSADSRLWGYLGMLVVFTFAVLYILMGVLRLSGIAEDQPEDRFN